MKSPLNTSLLTALSPFHVILPTSLCFIHYSTYISSWSWFLSSSHFLHIFLCRLYPIWIPSPHSLPFMHYLINLAVIVTRTITNILHPATTCVSTSTDSTQCIFGPYAAHLSHTHTKKINKGPLRRVQSNSLSALPRQTATSEGSSAGWKSARTGRQTEFMRVRLTRSQLAIIKALIYQEPWAEDEWVHSIYPRLISVVNGI